MRWDSDYNKSEQLVMEYKNNVPGASDRLIEVYDKFLIKFSRIINDSVVDLSNRCTRTFIGLFMPQVSYRSKMHLVSHSQSGMEIAGITVSLITSIFSRYERNEIDNIITMTFLECAKSYKKLTEDKPMFHTYLLKCFHFKLYHNLMDPLKDGLTLAMNDTHYNMIHNNHLETSKEDTYNLITYDRLLDRLYVEEDIEVDDNWIIGITADIFSEYTRLERKILKLKYIDNLTDEEVAEILAVSRKTLNFKKRAIISKIESDARVSKLLKE